MERLHPTPDDAAHGPEAITSVVAESLSLPRAPSGSHRRPRNLEGTDLLARYEVESVIGHGGMATVYRGRHKTIDKPVAIKVLDGALDLMPDAVERFLQEAQVTSQVIHENVVEVNDFGVTADGVVFSVMELLHGESLGDLVDQVGPLPPRRAAGIMLQICGALQAAHERGVIHRDLKPDNCFLTPRASNPDFIKVLDFGIARVTAGASCPIRGSARAHTEIGSIVGTPDYMSPEQARAEPFDHRVDIYAAGGLLFDLLTGRRPYQGGSAAALLAAHLHLPVPDPGEHVPGLCPALRNVVRTAMAKEPDDRYSSMVALGRAIDDAAREQERWGSARRRAIHRVTAVGAMSVLAIAYWSLGPPPRDLATVGLGELASAELVLAMRPRTPIETHVHARIEADHREPMPTPPMLAEASSTKSRARPIQTPRRATRTRRAVAEPVPATRLEDRSDDVVVPEPETMAAPRPKRGVPTDLKDPFADPPG